MATKERQTLIAPPSPNESIAVKRARFRKMGEESLETKPITQIQLLRKGTQREEYLVKVEDGTSHSLKSIGQNPKFLVFYNGQPLATCGVNYVPLFNAEIEQCVLNALEAVGRRPVSIDYAENATARRLNSSYLDIDMGTKKDYRWQMTAILEKDFEIPMGHLRQSDKFDWGIGITNSYDLSEGIHVYMYIYRQICSNGLYAWSVSGKKNFIHVEKELDHGAILNKVTEGISTIVEEHGSFFSRLDEMSKVMPTREQAALVMKRIGIRKYEATLLADRGVFVEFDKSVVKSVSFDTKMNSEYDLLNAITSISQDTNTMRRQIDLQTGLMEKILQARTMGSPMPMEPRT